MTLNHGTAGSSPATGTRLHNLDDILVLGRAQSGIFVTSKNWISKMIVFCEKPPKIPLPLSNDGDRESLSAAGTVCGILFHKTCQLDAILSATVEVKACMVSRRLNWCMPR